MIATLLIAPVSIILGGDVGAGFPGPIVRQVGATDEDTDTIVDSVDVDDDNDGILDVVEAPVLDADGLLARWSGDAGDPAATASGHVEPAGVNGGLATAPLVVDPGVGDLTAGAGLTLTGNGADSFDVTAIASSTAAEARTADEYLEVTFTTTATYGDLSEWAITTDGQALGYGYQVAIDLVIDPGTGGERIVEIAGDTTLPAGVGTLLQESFDLSIVLEPSTDYAVRVFVFDVPGDDGDVNFNDFQLFANARGVPDLDEDGVPDHLDLDADNDGISDLIESGQNQATVDPANDGRVDGAVDPVTGAPTAANGGIGVAPVNTDGMAADTATADFRDIDSDADGIPDAVEAYTTAAYVEVDQSSNSLATNGVNDSGITVPVDTDSDGTLDFRDTDSDGDAVADIEENGDVDNVLAGADADADGLDDNFDDVDDSGVGWTPGDGVLKAGIVAALGDADADAGAANGSATVPLRADVDFRDVPAEIAVAKNVAAPRELGGGLFALDYTFVIENTGAENLVNLSLVDDVDTAFGGNAFVAVETAPAIAASTATTDPGVNVGGYDGTNDLFTGGGLLEAGQTITVTMSARVDPADGGALLPFTNQATASADDTAAVLVTDLSDFGSIPDSTNGAGARDDATIVEADAIHVTTSVSAPVTAASGTSGNVDITFTHVVVGGGFDPLEQLSVDQDLPATFGGAFVAVTAGPTVTNTSAATPPAPDAGFAPGGNGDLLAGAVADELRPGQRFTVTYTAEIDPDAAPGSLPFVNQVTASGTPPAAAPVVTDLSDSGTDPDGSNVGAPGDTGGRDDATPIDVPLIGASLRQTGAVDAASGTPGNSDVTFEVAVQNRGSVSLTNLSIVDDLSTRLGTAFVGVTIAPVVDARDATTAPSADAAYDGSGDLLTGQATDSLEPGQQFDVVVVIEIDPDAAGAPPTLTNQATASGDDSDGATVSDLSDSGIDPDTDNGAGDESDATPVSIAGIAVAKSVVTTTSAGSGTSGNVDIEFRFVVANTGTDALSQLSLTDDFGAALGAAFVDVVDGPTVAEGSATTAPDADVAYNGAGDLLDGAVADDLRAGERFEVTVVVEATVASFPLDPTNQATAGGTPPIGGAITDLSDSGTDPTGTNPGAAGDSGGAADPTPISADAIAVAKSVDDVEAASSGTAGAFDVTYRFVVRNTGLSALDELSLIDDVADQVGGAFVRVVSAPTVQAGDASTAPAPNPAYDGTNDLLAGADADELAAGETFEVRVTIEVDPTAPSAVLPLTNQATATGENSADAVISDLSDSGTDPSSDNPGSDDDEGTADDPTILPLPGIGVAKDVVGDVVDNRDGTFELTYRILIENVGEVTLTGVEVTENLAATFAGVESFSVDAVRATGLTADPDFNGVANFELLTGTDSLAADAIGTVEIDITVEPGLEAGPFLNTATASAQGPLGPRVSDDSADGNDPDADGDGSVLDDNDPTPVEFRPESGLGAAKELIAGPVVDGTGGFTMTFRIRVENTDTLDVSDLQIVDDLDDTFPGLTASIVGRESDDFTLGSFDDGRLLAGTDSLAAGASGSIDIAVRVVAGGEFGPFENTALVAGRLPDGSNVNDVSDSGADADPMATNPGEPGDTGGTDDPTSFVLASVTGFDLSVDVSSLRVDEASNTIDWQVTLENRGPDAAPGEIRLTVAQPSSNTLGSPVAPAGWTLSRLSDGSFQFVLNGDLANGASQRFTLSTSAARSFDGLVTLRASVTSGDGSTVEASSLNNSDSQSIRLSGSNLPTTGSDAWLLVNIAVALLLAGCVLRSATYRRRLAVA